MEQLNRKQPGSYRDFLRSYAACVAFADAQVGRLLDALDESRFAANTIVVLWSDHGFHLGEKDHIEKFALWEKSTHVPLIIAAPHLTTAGVRCEQPVDLSVLYPTLLELCGIDTDDSFDGRSVVPLLNDPNQPWDTPAVMTYMPGNHAVRSNRWRYIRYADGSEELYDHNVDPNEWHNLAASDGSAEVIRRLRQAMPHVEAPPAADLR